MLREWATTCVQRSEDNLCKLILFFNHVGAQESNLVVLVAVTFTYEPAIFLAQLSFLIVNNAFGNRIYFNFNKVQFLFFFWGSCLSVFYLFGFDLLHYFCRVCLYVCVCCVQSCLPWHTCGRQRINSTKWVLEIKPGSWGFSLGAFIHWAMTNPHLGGRIGMNPLSNPKT